MRIYESGEDFENCRFRRFSNFSARQTGASRNCLSGTGLQRAVQGDDIFLQNLARCAMRAPLRNPIAGVAWSIGCTTHGVCTFFGHKARRREGDKCFFWQIFFRRGFFLIGHGVARARAGNRCTWSVHHFLAGEKKPPY